MTGPGHEGEPAHLSTKRDRSVLPDARARVQDVPVNQPSPVDTPETALALPAEDDAALLRRLAWQTVGSALVLMGGAAAVSAVFHAELVAVSEWFVATFGGLGVVLGFWISDAAPMPFPPDAFTVFALFGGMPFWEVVALGSLGSVLGGVTGWGIGRQLSQVPWYRRVMERHGATTERLLRKYGDAALVGAIFTPLPYSLASWACGALGMPLGRFVAWSLLRSIRVGGYLWAAQLGFVSVID